MVFYSPMVLLEILRTPLPAKIQSRNAFLLGCVGAWSLHPIQIDIARRVFNPPMEEILWAKRVVKTMGDNTEAAMLGGKMQDDAAPVKRVPGYPRYGQAARTERQRSARSLAVKQTKLRNETAGSAKEGKRQTRRAC